MKKIIATVLAMVMALALCTTAFAAIPVWSTNGSTSSVDLFDGKYNTKVASGTMAFTAAKAPTFDKDGNATKAGNIAYYTFTSTNSTYDVQRDGTYILVNSIPADAKAADYVLVKTADSTVDFGYNVQANQTGKDQTLIMKKVDAVDYLQTGSLFTAWGDKCGQYADPKNTDTVDYVTFNNVVVTDKPAQVWALAATDTNTNWKWNILVGSEVYTIDPNGQQEAKAHVWTASAWDKDGDATEYKCATCKTVAKVINASINAPAGSTVEQLSDGTLIAFTYTPAGSTAATGTATSPKTFDAGIAMYVGMALTSVAGSAVVIGKKKEF